MTGGILGVLVMVAVPAAFLGLVVARIAVKRRKRDAFVERILAPYERLPHDCFRRRGRVFRLQADLNPLFGRGFGLRLSTFADTRLEFEIRAARNVPTKTPQRLKEDPFYRRFVLDAPSTDEAVEHLAAVRERLAPVFPSRWGAYAKVQTEVVLSANTATDERLDGDVDALAELAAVPAARRPRGGTWTIREGFEADVPAWHWKREQRARFPSGLRRWCVSAWYDNAYLNEPLAEFLWSLGPGRVLTAEEDLWFLEHSFGRPMPVDGRLAELKPGEAVAGDQWLDGDLFGGFVVGAKADAFRGAIKFSFHDRGIEALRSGAAVYARRLFDDEFSWFSGEYEVLAAEGVDVRGRFREIAERYHAEVKEINRPFSFKLLKEDRLEVSF